MSKSVFEIKLPCPPPHILDTDSLRGIISSHLGSENSTLILEETQCTGAICEGTEVYLLTFRSDHKPIFARALANSYAGHLQRLFITLV